MDSWDIIPSEGLARGIITGLIRIPVPSTELPLDKLPNALILRAFSIHLNMNIFFVHIDDPPSYDRKRDFLNSLSDICHNYSPLIIGGD
jgi:hypothetical protein